MSIASASAAGCAFVGSVAQSALKPIEVAARHPKAAKAALGGLAAAPFAIDVVDDEDDDLDEEKEVAQP